MRKSNQARLYPCNCEHIDHMKGPRRNLSTHRYMKQSCDNAFWALWIGHVCRECADTHMKDYILDDHVCGTGDCDRQADGTSVHVCSEFEENGSCIHSDHTK